MIEIILIVLSAVIIILLAFVIYLLKQQSDAKLSEEVSASLRDTRIELNESFQSSVKHLGSQLQDSQDRNFDFLNKYIQNSLEQNSKMQQEFNHNLLNNQNELRNQVSQTLNASMQQTEQKLENIRKTVADSITNLQEENSKKLDEMRNVVDEKLQKTLEDRLTKSFSTVSERLEEVHRGLGEMQAIASDVGDLKNALTNVKTRGTLGETQLQNIIEELLIREQYDTNVVTKKGSSARVEFAIKLPGHKDQVVYLPIDAKFPLTVYHNLNDAYEKGDKDLVEKHQKDLINSLKGSAKDISEKYIDVPNTTDFAIMFLPIEGLYAEAVRLGVSETLQRDYKVVVAGPTTMAALLNSLQMGFRTLAIQEKSHEVWNTLGAVKTEFDNFSKVLESTKKKLQQAERDLDLLVGRRTRAMQKALEDVEALDYGESKKILQIPEDE